MTGMYLGLQDMLRPQTGSKQIKQLLLLALDNMGIGKQRVGLGRLLAGLQLHQGQCHDIIRQGMVMQDFGQKWLEIRDLPGRNRQPDGNAGKGWALFGAAVMQLHREADSGQLSELQPVAKLLQQWMHALQDLRMSRKGRIKINTGMKDIGFGIPLQRNVCLAGQGIKLVSELGPGPLKQPCAGQGQPLAQGGGMQASAQGSWLQIATATLLRLPCQYPGTQRGWRQADYCLMPGTNLPQGDLYVLIQFARPLEQPEAGFNIEQQAG